MAIDSRRGCELIVGPNDVPLTARPNWGSLLNDQPEATRKPDRVAAQHTHRRHRRHRDQARRHRDQARRRLPVVRFRRTVDKALTTAGKWFEAYQEPDGTLRVAGIITALLQEPPVPAIAIEEPVLTVHPGAEFQDSCRLAIMRSSPWISRIRCRTPG
jgi:hypothetical protein